MYIVTGGAGFIGSAMIWKLNTLGIDDILVVDNLSTSEKWKNLVNRRYREYMHRDAFMEILSDNGFEEPIEAVIHMGACSSTTE
jgi:ADP-L-glycero-D-manno-heptose 6-epimerase